MAHIVYNNKISDRQYMTVSDY